MARHTGSKLTAGGLSKIEYFYQVFNRIRCRTTDPTNSNYPNYGGRGIKFEWVDYMDFKKDMYESWLEHKKRHPGNTSIERIDPNGNYSKENCRWATMQEQSKNKRTTRYLTYEGRTMIIADWARELGVSRQAIRYRNENGWPADKIIETPFLPTNRYDKVNKTITSSIGVPIKKSK